MKTPQTILILAACASCAGAAQFGLAQAAKLTPKERYEALTLTTPAYEAEAIRVITSEASKVAIQLHLSEDLPITKDRVTQAHISPPRLKLFSEGLGNISTSNYTYCIVTGNKLSYVMKRDIERDYNSLQANHRWSIKRIDTNAAYRLATSWLRSMSVSVEELNRDCHLSVRPWIPEPGKGYFVPVYRISWSRKWAPPDWLTLPYKTDSEPVATVELFLPKRILLELRLEKADYIHRDPLVITNTEALLSLTNRARSWEGRNP